MSSNARLARRMASTRCSGVSWRSANRDTSSCSTACPVSRSRQLVTNVREALNAEGFQRVRIVVSGGFTVDKIRRFEDQGVPVDAYGVGSSLYGGRFDFTSDVVRVDGKPCAKVGRSELPNPRLDPVT